MDNRCCCGQANIVLLAEADRVVKAFTAVRDDGKDSDDPGIVPCVCVGSLSSGNIHLEHAVSATGSHTLKVLPHQGNTAHTYMTRPFL